MLSEKGYFVAATHANTTIFHLIIACVHIIYKVDYFSCKAYIRIVKHHK